MSGVETQKFFNAKFDHDLAGLDDLDRGQWLRRKSRVYFSMLAIDTWSMKYENSSTRNGILKQIR